MHKNEEKFGVSLMEMLFFLFKRINLSFDRLFICNNKKIYSSNHFEHFLVRVEKAQNHKKKYFPFRTIEFILNLGIFDIYKR